ncbi:hypothetical protein Tsubulata_019411, partial [Turnera subulata]
LLTSKRTRQVVYTPCRSPPPPPSRPPSLPHRHPPPLPLSSSARIANLFTRFLCLSTYLTVGHLLGYRQFFSFFLGFEVQKMEPMDVAGKSKEDAWLPQAHSRNGIGCKQPNAQIASKPRRFLSVWWICPAH